MWVQIFYCCYSTFFLFHYRQFSSFGDAPPYPGPPPSYFAPRGEGHPGDGYSPVHHTYSAPLLPPPPPHPATLSSPALSPASPGHLVDFPHPHISPDIQNAPLNLSLSSCPSTASSSLTRQQPRPSVITCAASSMSTSTSGSSSPRSSHNGHMVLGSSSSSDDPIGKIVSHFVHFFAYKNDLIKESKREYILFFLYLFRKS